MMSNDLSGKMINEAPGHKQREISRSVESKYLGTCISPSCASRQCTGSEGTITPRSNGPGTAVASSTPKTPHEESMLCM